MQVVVFCLIAYKIRQNVMFKLFIQLKKFEVSLLKTKTEILQLRCCEILLADLLVGILLYHADLKYLLRLHRNTNILIGALSCHSFPVQRFYSAFYF